MTKVVDLHYLLEETDEEAHFQCSSYIDNVVGNTILQHGSAYRIRGKDE